MFERGEEPTVEQAVIAFEKRAPESDLRLAAALSAERQPDTLFPDEHQPSYRPDSRERDTEPARHLPVHREPKSPVQITARL